MMAGWEAAGSGEVAAALRGAFSATRTALAGLKGLFTSKGSGNGSGVTVIGSYPQYTQLAQKMGANYFSMPAEEWAQMTPAEQWAANQAFLDDAIARGDTFVFSNDFAPAGSFYEQELQYLQQQRVFEPGPGPNPLEAN